MLFLYFCISFQFEAATDLQKIKFKDNYFNKLSCRMLGIFIFVIIEMFTPVNMNICTYIFSHFTSDLTGAKRNT
jgi:hypothetical protein